MDNVTMKCHYSKTCAKSLALRLSRLSRCLKIESDTFPRINLDLGHETQTRKLARTSRYLFLPLETVLLVKKISVERKRLKSKTLWKTKALNFTDVRHQ